ncbi:xanthine dehydrogenase family protein molybdopterin-binding subunit [Cochlodiniinecator piscidefendens]|uniref:xanthine dehydrogenase family protein molybdopterin-binding subunit n=1 Tax=Cochlodiniinecator piscidefendens TaxID=2715756 RepID=UPI00140C7871|nr:molybdopterin cofactor-binding domain-containing protein [Cochlodiniinecator piscidefendens]
MGKLKTYTRRAFLISSAAIAGGVAFGYYAYKKPVENPLLNNLAEGEAALTPYVLITTDGITLITPRADKGQGAYSVQAALIAEELDVDLNTVAVSPGVPSAAYFNAAVAGEGFPFMATDESFAARQARGFGGVLAKLIGMQITGGSSTVPDAYEKLRVAGAVARETLKEAASQESGVPAGQLRTENGAVYLPDGTSLTYTALATTAASIEPVAEVVLKQPSEWRYLGKDMQRIDIVAKSTGTLKYGIDQTVDGMLHATVRTNPRIGGPMIGYDASIAETMRGVEKIVPINGGVGVIADNTWRAFQAANSIQFDWGPAPYPATTEEMWAQTSAAFSPEFQDSQFRADGDVDAAIGETTIEAEYRVPHLAHAALEPMNAIVLVTATRVDIWTGTQIPRFMQANVAKQTGVDHDDIHIHVEMMGGSFGRRLEDVYVAQAVELAMTVPGTPIKMTWSREEDMTHDFPRPMMMARGRGSINDGKIEGIDLGIAAPSIIENQLGRQGQWLPGPDTSIVAGAWDQPFAIPNYRVTGYRVPAMVPISSWRSVGASGNGFFHDCFLDELIHAAGADPVEERLRLCNDPTSRKVIEAAAEMSNWGSPLAQDQGRGIAFCLSFGVPVAEVIEVVHTDQGIRIDKAYVAANVGKIIDPINFDNLMKGGVIFGLGHAMNCELTYSDGMAEQDNFHAFEAMRLYQCPKIEVRGLELGDKVRGIGEPPVPPAAPALANAIFSATGQRIRELPLNKHINFV